MKKLSYLGLLLLLSFQAYADQESPTYAISCHIVDFSGYYDLNYLANLGKKENGDDFLEISDDKSVLYYLGLCREIKRGEVTQGSKFENSEKQTLIKYDAITDIIHHNDANYLEYYASKGEGAAELQIKLICDPDGPKDKEPKFFNVTNTPLGNNRMLYTAEVKHRHACAVFSIAEFFHKHGIPFSIGFIIGGLIIAFLGQKLFKIVFFVLGALAVTAIIFLIFYQAWLIKMHDDIDKNLLIAFGVSGVIGIAVGILLVVYNKWCFFAIGGILGGLGGFLLYTAIVAKFLPVVILLLTRSGPYTSLLPFVL